MTDRQLWMWMLGRGRKAQLTSKLKPGTVPVPCEMLVILHSCLTFVHFSIHVGATVQLGRDG